MRKITTAEFRKGMYVEFRGVPAQIVEFQHINPGKGAAFVRTKLKLAQTGQVLEKTYKSGEHTSKFTVNTVEMQYLYSDTAGLHFMNRESYDQFIVAGDIVGSFRDFLRVGEVYQLLVLDDEVVGMRLPKRVKLTVIDTSQAVKGDTVSQATKPARLESGLTLQVPLFVKAGDVIAVNPETGEYIERAKT